MERVSYANPRLRIGEDKLERAQSSASTHVRSSEDRLGRVSYSASGLVRSSEDGMERVSYTANARVRHKDDQTKSLEYSASARTRSGDYQMMVPPSSGSILERSGQDGGKQSRNLHSMLVSIPPQSSPGGDGDHINSKRSDDEAKARALDWGATERKGRASGTPGERSANHIECMNCHYLDRLCKIHTVRQATIRQEEAKPKQRSSERAKIARPVSQHVQQECSSPSSDRAQLPSSVPEKKTNPTTTKSSNAISTLDDFELITKPVRPTVGHYKQSSDLLPGDAQFLSPFTPRVPPANPMPPKTSNSGDKPPSTKGKEKASPLGTANLSTPGEHTSPESRRNSPAIPLARLLAPSAPTPPPSPRLSPCSHKSSSPPPPSPPLPPQQLPLSTLDLSDSSDSDWEDVALEYKNEALDYDADTVYIARNDERVRRRGLGS